MSVVGTPLAVLSSMLAAFVRICFSPAWHFLVSVFLGFGVYPCYSLGLWAGLGFFRVRVFEAHDTNELDELDEL